MKRSVRTKSAVPTATSDSQRPPRIFLLEDHPVMRLGLKMILTERGFEVCGEAERPDQAIPMLAECGAEVAILDLSLGGELALELISDLRRRFPDLLILVYSMHDTPLFVESALRAGANGYVTKADMVDALVEAIAAVRAGKRHFGTSLAKMSESGHGDVRAVQAALTELSPRELEVVTLLGQGYGLSEIAARMSISGRTIETHLVRLRAKLGVKSNRELTRAAIQFLHPA